MKRRVRRAEQRHRSRRPHKRYHRPDERIVTIQPIVMVKTEDGVRMHWQGDGWYKMAAGHRADE